MKGAKYLLHSAIDGYYLWKLSFTQEKTFMVWKVRNQIDSLEMKGVEVPNN
jgi:hypothetical protein